MLVDLDFSGAPFLPEHFHGVSKIRFHNEGPETGWYFTEEANGEELLWCGFYRHQLGVYSALAEEAFFRRQYGPVISDIDSYACEVLGVPWEKFLRWLAWEAPSSMLWSGIADSIEQILAHEGYQWLLTCEQPVVLIANEQKKENHPGWRWEKSGQYIGVQEPLEEYFMHEPVIERVWMYQFHMLLGDNHAKQ